MQEECYNYRIYVSENTKTIKPNASFAGGAGYTTEITVDGIVKSSNLKTGIFIANSLKKLTIDVSSGMAVLKFNMVENQTKAGVIYTFTFQRFTTSPDELAVQISALPSAENAVYSADLYGIVCARLDIYQGFTEEEQAQVTNIDQLLALKARLEELKLPYEAEIQALSTLVSSYAGNVTSDNYRQYLGDVRAAEIKYLSLSDAQRADFERTSSVAGSYWPAYYTATLAAIKNGDALGYPTQYPDDFMLRGSYYNLDLDQEVETGFREIWTNT